MLLLHNVPFSRTSVLSWILSRAQYRSRDSRDWPPLTVTGYYKPIITNAGLELKKMKSTDIRVETVDVAFDDERLSVPLHLSKGVIEVITYVTVTLQARTRGGVGRTGCGRDPALGCVGLPRAGADPRGEGPADAPAVQGNRRLVGG